MQPIGEAFHKRLMRIRYLFNDFVIRANSGAAARRIIFMHIPKAAGSTVNAYFKTRFGADRSRRVVVLDDHKSPDWEERLEAARQARFVYGHFGGATLDAIRGDAFVFTFLRDPLDRIKSAYAFLAGHHDESVRIRNHGLKAFVASRDPADLLYTDNGQTRQIAVAFDYRDALSMPREEWLDRALERLSTFDHIGFVEDFDDSLFTLIDKLAMDCPSTIDPRNTTRQELTKTGIRIVQSGFSSAALELAAPRVDMDMKIYEAARSMPAA